MAKRYQHRIGVRAEICFDLIFDICDPAPQQISQAVAEGSPTDRGRRRRVQARSPNWWNRLSRLASVDPEVEPGPRLDPSATLENDRV
jgi:hypothetical protein